MWQFFLVYILHIMNIKLLNLNVQIFFLPSNSLEDSCAQICEINVSKSRKNRPCGIPNYTTKKF